MNKLIRNTFMPGKYNNYLVGGNICNAFALGEIGSVDDFFLIGSEPPYESIYPMITGNVLDSEGNVLFRLVKNMLIINPGNCSKIVGDQIGYEIHDSSGKLILKLSTMFERNPQLNTECFITTISGNLYNKQKQLVFKAASGTADERIEANCKCAFGFSGGFGFVQKYDNEEMDMLRVALITHGSVHQRISGDIAGESINIEGKYFQNARLNSCKITITEGDFFLGRNNTFNGCEFLFKERAGKIFELAKLLLVKK